MSTDAAAQQASAAQTQAMVAKQQELKRALEEAPKLEVPWQLLESCASKARIRALAKTLDPTMELDDGAVQLVDDLMGRWVEEVTSMGGEVAHARAARVGGLPVSAAAAATAQHQRLATGQGGGAAGGGDSTTPLLLRPQDLHLVLSEVWPSVLGQVAGKPWGGEGGSAGMPQLMKGYQQQQQHHQQQQVQQFQQQQEALAASAAAKGRKRAAAAATAAGAGGGTGGSGSAAAPSVSAPAPSSSSSSSSSSSGAMPPPPAPKPATLKLKIGGGAGAPSSKPA